MLDLVIAKDWQALEDSMHEIMLEQIQAMPQDQQTALGDPEEVMRERILPQIEAMKGPWFQNFLTYDVGQDWAKITVPVLALFGGLDVQVDADQNSPALKAALEKAKNPDVTVKVFPDANHLFQKADDRERAGVCHLARRFRAGLSGHYRRLVRSSQRRHKTKQLRPLGEDPRRTASTWSRRTTWSCQVQLFYSLTAVSPGARCAWGDFFGTLWAVKSLSSHCSRLKEHPDV